MEERGGRLTAVDDLQALCRSDLGVPFLVPLKREIGHRDGQAIVVGEEHAWIVPECVPDTLVDLPAVAKEGSHVLLKDPPPESVIEASQNIARHHAHVGVVPAFLAQANRKRCDPLAVLGYEVDLDILSALCGCFHTRQARNVPEVDVDLLCTEG